MGKTNTELKVIIAILLLALSTSSQLLKSMWTSWTASICLSVRPSIQIIMVKKRAKRFGVWTPFLQPCLTALILSLEVVPSLTISFPKQKTKQLWLPRTSSSCSGPARLWSERQTGGRRWNSNKLVNNLQPDIYITGQTLEKQKMKNHRQKC